MYVSRSLGRRSWGCILKCNNFLVISFSHIQLLLVFPAPSSCYICQDKVLYLEDLSLNLLLVLFLSHFADAVFFKGQKTQLFLHYSLISYICLETKKYRKGEKKTSLQVKNYISSYLHAKERKITRLLEKKIVICK